MVATWKVAGIADTILGGGRGHTNVVLEPRREDHDRVVLGLVRVDLRRPGAARVLERNGSGGGGD